MSNPSWSRLIRFIGSSSAEPQYGEPVADDFTDIGKLADEGKLRARVVEVDRAGPLAASAEVTDEVVDVKELLGPLDIGDVPDVKCIGLNYKKHIAEGGRAPPPYPSLFIKSSTTIAGYNSVTIVPKCAQENEADYEAEVCIVIGEDCKDVSAETALDYVAGYTVGNDVSSRKWQREPSRAGGVPQWCFSKGFDGYCPIGPCIVSKKVGLDTLGVMSVKLTIRIIPDPSTLDIKLSVNGEQRQISPVSDLLFNTQAIVAFLSQGTTLRRGTVIMTGTPHGVGCVGPEEKWKYLKDGDKVEVYLSEVGTLRHTIKYE